MAGPLLATKLHVPRRRRSLVARPRLMQRLSLVTESQPGTGRHSCRTGRTATVQVVGKQPKQRTHTKNIYAKLGVNNRRAACVVDTVDFMDDQPEPHTVASLSADLRSLGVVSSDVVLLHSSRSSIGFVAGGPQAIVQAFLDVLGQHGTLVVPTHTPENTDPATWRNPPVKESWWSVIREQSPGFDPALTPASRWMGILAETVRTWPGAVRSNHPQVSFAAIGAHAAAVTAGHRLDAALGDQSPLGGVYRLDGKVLMLGVGYDSSTSLHLAEWRQREPPLHDTGSSIRQADGSGLWVMWTDVAEDEDDFERIGADFESGANATRIGSVGNATAKLMSQRALVDYATQWMADNRGRTAESVGPASTQLPSPN